MGGCFKLQFIKRAAIDNYLYVRSSSCINKKLAYDVSYALELALATIGVRVQSCAHLSPRFVPRPTIRAGMCLVASRSVKVRVCRCRREAQLCWLKLAPSWPSGNGVSAIDR